MTAGARPEQVATFVGTPYNQGDSTVAVAVTYPFRACRSDDRHKRARFGF